MRTQLIGAATVALFLCPIPALAGGSDSPTPYTVGVDGISFPAPLEAHGHVNIKTEQGNFGVHFDPNNGHPGGAWIGKSFMPWSAFSDASLCVTWVQVHGYDSHFGEGGQEPIGPGCGPSVEDAQPEPTPDPTEEPTPDPEPTPEPQPTPEPTPEPELTEEPTEEPAPTPDPEPEEPTEEPAPEPDPEPTDEPEPTPDPEPEPEPTRPEKPAPQWYGDKSYDCESGLVTVVDYRADWVWDDGEWVLGGFEYVSESSGPIDQPICDDSSEGPVDEGVGEAVVVDRPNPVDPDTSPAPSTPTPDKQGDDTKPAPTPSAAVDRVELAETGAEDKLVAAAALLFLGGLALLTFRGRR